MEQANLTRKAPKRIAATVLGALKGGVVPRVGLEYITVGRMQEIHALLHDVEIIRDGGAAFRFIVGQYGAGKSFLLQTIRNHVMDRLFVVLDCDLSPERRFCGTKGQGLATYKELVRNMSVRTRPEGGALPLILDKWLNNIQTEIRMESPPETEESQFEAAVSRKIFDVIRGMEDMVNGFDFGQAISRYYIASKHGDDEAKSKVLRWFFGEYATKTEARQALGINLIVNDDNWYDFLKLFSAFLVRAGYAGMYILVDELVNIYRIPHRTTRQYNYEKILAMYNDALQGKAHHIGILMSATPQCVEDTDKGIFSYDALKSRLTEGRFSTKGMRDLLAPIIRLEPLSHEEMMVLVEKLAALHAQLYDYNCDIAPEEYLAFLKTEFERIGAGIYLTPREIIRDFVELLNVLIQNPGKRIGDILQDPAFEASKTPQPDETGAEFAAFEV
ncbi:MAG: ATP-binding protein [Oscillospiraceae bacterium]|nr:ATP-binding protein [Oscillospiraceae bacterium]